MNLCHVSRRANKWVTRHDEMLCTTLHRTGHWSRHVVDTVFYFRDGPDHCMRMAVIEDNRGWGVSDPLVDVRRAGL